jgi:2-haloacid dehalogenase
MRRYADFDTCTAQALRYVSASLGVSLAAAEERALLESYRHLPAYPDVRNGLDMLQKAGYRLVALTNGTESSVRSVLRYAGIDGYVAEILSVDRIATFKPDPAVYALVNTPAEGPDGRTWLVSGNPFDVIGAKASGLKAAWLRRDPQRVFDPWEFSADLVVATLEELCGELQRLER